MINYNPLSLEVYSSGTTRIIDPAGDLARFTGLTFRSIYPGGIFASASFYIPRPVLRAWQLAGAQRVIFRNRNAVAFEGYIDSIGPTLDYAAQGVQVELTGAWGELGGNTDYIMNWADGRVSNDVWVYDTTATGAEKCGEDRQERLQLTPELKAWSTNEYASLKYTAPTGTTIKKLIYNYDLQEAGEQWTLSLYDATNGTSWSVNTTGTGGPVTTTLGTPVQSVEFRMTANANQTPASADKIYGQINTLTLYCVTTAITPTGIIKDIRSNWTAVNAEEAYIASNTLDITPIITDGLEPISDILKRVADFGDSSNNAWAAGFRHSEYNDGNRVTTIDGKPLLYFQQQPALTAYDYQVSAGDANVVPPLGLKLDYYGVRNWIAANYTDANGYRQIVTPADDATLTDAASVALYRHKAQTLSGDYTSLDAAKAMAKAYLAQNKDPHWLAPQPIRVVGYIKDNKGLPVPASLIQPGRRVKLMDYPTTEIFLITETNYDHASETCSISCGKPDIFAQMVAQLEIGR